MKRLFNLSGRAFAPFFANVAGAIFIPVLIGIAGGVLLDLAVYAGLKFTDYMETTKKVNDCINAVNTAKDALEKSYAGATGSERYVPPTDPNYLTIKNCQDLLTQIKNDIDSGKVPGLGSKANQLNGLVNNTLSGWTVGNSVCTMDDPPGGAYGGCDFQFNVNAQIPYPNNSTRASLNMTGVVSAMPFNDFKPVKDGVWVGTFKFLKSENAGVSGTSSINVAAATDLLDGSGNPIKPPCGQWGATVDQSGNKCVMTCNVSKSMTWKAIPKPSAILEITPDMIDEGSTETVTLSYTLKGVSAAAIDNGVGQIGGLNGVDPTIEVKGTKVLSTNPNKSTTYTLNAFGLCSQGSDSDSAVLTVRKSGKAVGVAITSPKANDLVSDFSVNVSGTVTPAPTTAGTRAQIIVNGASYISPVDVGTDGSFSGTTPLMNTISWDDVWLTGNSSETFSQCGTSSSPISIMAAGMPAKNLIRVRILSSDPNATGSLGEASVQVEHVVSVNNFNVKWGASCEGTATSSKNQDLNLILKAGQPAISVGSVDVSVDATYANTKPISCNIAAAVGVGTSVESIVSPQIWKIDVPCGCPSTTGVKAFDSSVCNMPCDDDKWTCPPSGWGACQPNGKQTCTAPVGSPQGCAGNPSQPLTQSCTYCSNPSSPKQCPDNNCYASGYVCCTNRSGACPANTPVCVSNGCCPSGYPNLCPDGVTCYSTIDQCPGYGGGGGGGGG